MNIHDKSDVVKNEIEMTYHTEERNKLPLSYDIWEMHEGVHLYSLASIYAAFRSMIAIDEIMEPEYKENRLKLEAIHKMKNKITKYMDEIKKYISKELYNETTKSLRRNRQDEKTDISMLGVAVPFRLFGPKEKKVVNTVEKINLTLRTYTGGYTRFEGDYYRGGKPWVISNLWMANYYLETGENKKARECFDFVLKTSGMHGYLSEQIDNNLMAPAWIIGLGWSHAMFIITLEKMIKKGLVK